MSKNLNNKPGSDQSRTGAGPNSPSHPLTPSPSHLVPSPTHPIVVPHAGLAEPILYTHPAQLPGAPGWTKPRIPGAPALDYTTSSLCPRCTKETDAPTVTEI